jgi:hypothetical protein
MAWYTFLYDFFVQFIIYGGYTLGVLVLLGTIFYVPIRNKIFPIVFIIRKNAGGAGDNSQIMMTRKLTRRGRIVNTPYGPRVKILGYKWTQPMTLVSSEHAIPWEAGGRIFELYEKEYGQIYPVNPHLTQLEFKKAAGASGEKLRKVYEWLCEKFPDLQDRFVYHDEKTLRKRKAVVLRPVVFANDHVKLQPVPTDMITQQNYNARIRREVMLKQGFWEKYGQYVMTALIIGALIVVTVLSYEQVDKAAQYRLSAAATQAEPTPGEKLANAMAGEQAPGGGMVLPFLPYLFGRRRWFHGL